MSRSNSRSFYSALLIGLMVATGGCASTVLTRGQSQAMDRQIALTHRLWLWGLVEESAPINADQVCGNSTWTKIETGFPLFHAAVGVLTAGVYLPARVVVSCRDFVGQKR